MALVNCRECGGQVSTGAKACPHCGSRKYKPKTKALIVAASLFGILIVCGMCGTEKEAERTRLAAEAEARRVATLTPEQRKVEEDGRRAAAELAAKQEQEKKAQERLSNAQFACEEFVKKSLHDPDSAEFDDFRTFPIREKRDGRYIVTVGVRARNAFNAIRYAQFTCETRFDGSNWYRLRVNQLED